VEKRTIAILFGGCSAEYEVSLKSAHAVITHLDRTRYAAVLIGITRQGQWFRYSGHPDKIPDDTWHSDVGCVPAIISPDKLVKGIVEFRDGIAVTTRIDAAFPVMHGRYGEDGTLQGLLELAGIPVIGCDTLSSALCMDKEMAHKIVETAGIAVPRSIIVDGKLTADEIAELAKPLSYPLYVKPVRAGSSFGITKISAEAELYSAVANALEYDLKAIVEEEVAGFEVGCAVLGNDELLVGEVDEIELQQGFFDYTEKYSLKTSKIHMPARIDAQLTAQVKRTAAVIYRTLGCRGFARVDMFITPGGGIVFNEVNTIPGLTAHSRYPNMLKGVGITFGDMLDKLIRLAIDE